MKNIRTVVGVVALIALVAGGIILLSKNRDGMPDTQTVPAPEQQTAEQPSNTVQKPAANKPGTYTLTQVATHASVTSCWSVIRGGVYDLTAWISKHPGGPQAILGICGIDATAKFDAQHGGQEKPEKALASFKIGTLQ
jgi:cytochrome b involved in lipid metabolism